MSTVIHLPEPAMRPCWLRFLALSAVAVPVLATAPDAARAQDAGGKRPAKTVSVPGYRFRVLGAFDEETGAPIEGVEVRDLISGNSALTTSTGTVSLVFVPDGGSMIRLRKIGYATQTMFVSIDSMSRSPVTAVMSHAVQLPTVVSTAKATDPAYSTPNLVGFAERAKEGFGRYLMNETIRKQDYKSLADMLRQLGGMTIVTDQHGLEYASAASGVGGASGLAFGAASPSDRCRATVYLGSMNLGQPDLRSLPQPTELAGIEWYPHIDETPVEYTMTNSGCGVLVLWQRAR
ncbi:MAG TPA: hypothetical protein VN651_09840 [Gemmatimonadaceae bacterium]|nr:hypothetical protein [Gemmatimonadaceae bacterium]